MFISLKFSDRETEWLEKNVEEFHAKTRRHETENLYSE